MRLNAPWAISHLRLLVILVPFLVLAVIWLSRHLDDRPRSVAVAVPSTRSDSNSARSSDREQRPHTKTGGRVVWRDHAWRDTKSVERGDASGGYGEGASKRSIRAS